MHILEEKFGSSCTNVEFIYLFFWESRALCSPPREEHLSALHRPSLPPASSAGLKTRWGRSSVRYTNVYVPGTALTSCFCSLLPTPSWKPQKAVCSQSRVRCLPASSGGVGRSDGDTGSALQPRDGQDSRDRAARGEAVLAQLGGMPSSSCPPQGPLRPVWLFPNRLSSEVSWKRDRTLPGTSRDSFCLLPCTSCFGRAGL